MSKWKEHKGSILITSIIILLPILIGLLLWNKLPNEIATHFGANGEADGWSSKGFAVFGLPLFILACHLLCCAGTCADPKNQRIGDKIFKLILWICPLVSLFCAVSIYGYALGMNTNVDTIGKLFVGVIFIVIGNYLPKCRQNYTVGIKLPWTLHNEENWNRTHRMAGWLWMCCGVVFMLLVFVKFDDIWLVLALIAVMVLVPTAYSFIYYLKHK